MISCPRRQSNDDGDKYSDDLSSEDSNQRSNEIGLSVSKSTDTPNLAITPYQEPAATMGSDTLVHVENSEEQGEQFIQLRCDDLSCETPKGDGVATLNDCSRKSNEESTGLSNFGWRWFPKKRLLNAFEAEATIDLGKDLGIAFDGDDDFLVDQFAKHIANDLQLMLLKVVG
ncbi:hypothetical protein GH714_035008 [Hevea brasiliensis]|uniref:Uncharacterized protein n=1 Tax=Hevea brasiliensis TaxID=3981 RepID=A0A6A6NED9_HEVBR|nr:hypothetical protein GH714_035008 [Hevea brasiliensis]